MNSLPSQILNVVCNPAQQKNFYLAETIINQRPNMAEVILFNIRTKHQHVCSTFARLTKPTLQKPTLQKSCKRSIIQHSSSSNIFQHRFIPSTFKSLCYAQNTMPTHHPTFYSISPYKNSIPP